MHTHANSKLSSKVRLNKNRQMANIKINNTQLIAIMEEPILDFALAINPQRS